MNSGHGRAAGEGLDPMDFTVEIARCERKVRGREHNEVPSYNLPQNPIETLGQSLSVLFFVVVVCCCICPHSKV